MSVFKVHDLHFVPISIKCTDQMLQDYPGQPGQTDPFLKSILGHSSYLFQMV